MEIIIDENITINTDLAFEAQSQEAQNYVYGIINSVEPVTQQDAFNRSLIETRSNELITVTVTSDYQTQSAQRMLNGQTIEIGGVE